jgi:glycosyltransferase involved in cell wall biosynthesis
MEKYNYRHISAAICGNQESVTVLRRKGYQGAATVIPQFGVDPDIYLPHSTSPSEFTIGYLGRLIVAKGLHTLLDAVEEMEGGWRLLLVGDGPMRREIEARISSPKLNGRVEIRKPVPSATVPDLLPSLSVLVLPSLTTESWKEQFGRVLIEAMACEVPVIGSDSGEIPNVIGQAGMIFPEGDVKLLRERLKRLRDDEELRTLLGKAGRQRVLGQYTQAKIASATFAVYQEMLAG